MQEDFHYYATYAAAYLAGYSHKEAMEICYSAQFVDLCSVTLLSKLKGPKSAATTQFQLELMDHRTDILGLQEITKIWAAFHFLPRDLYANKKGAGKRYLAKFRLICGPNGELLKKTVELAKGRSLQSVGIAMHVLADTWAHTYFAGTPSLVINNTNYDFYELVPDGDGFIKRKIRFRHKTSEPDDIENGLYTGSLFQTGENSIMNLGHGRAGHFPDYSFARYRYLPAWADYRQVVKDNPSDYMKAFRQMVYAMKFIRSDEESFETERYDTESVDPYESRIKEILEKRQLNACADWKAFGEELSGQTIEDFDIEKYQQEYRTAQKGGKAKTFLGKFFYGALSHKEMVSTNIKLSGNYLTGIPSVKRRGKG